MFFFYFTSMKILFNDTFKLLQKGFVGRMDILQVRNRWFVCHNPTSAPSKNVCWAFNCVLNVFDNETLKTFADAA